MLGKDRYAKEKSVFRTWMTRILINKCNDILRAGQRTVFTDEPLEIEYMENEFLNLEWKEMLQVLMRNTGSYFFFIMEKDFHKRNCTDSGTDRKCDKEPIVKRKRAGKAGI